MKKYLYSNGVSLIELLVIIAIIGIFATLGTQGYRSWVSGSNFISMKTVGIIPVRLESTRLPDKAIADICGLPMFVHTC